MSAAGNLGRTFEISRLVYRLLPLRAGAVLFKIALLAAVKAAINKAQPPPYPARYDATGGDLF